MTVSTRPHDMINFDHLHPSPFNRRREWGSLDELAASIKTDGILEPLLVRARDPNEGGFELIAGERRLQAARIVGLQEVPVIILEATDEEAIRISAVENLQRENPHPLDEADSYRDLQKENKANTVPVIAAMVGKPAVYIYRRLKLHDLHKAVRESFERHEITVAHAERLARLDPKQQKTALIDACCFQRTLFEPGTYKQENCPVEPAPLGKLDDWIERNTKVDPASPDAQNYFPEFADALGEPDTLLQLSASDMPGALLQDKKHGLVGTRRWVPVKGKKCKYSRQGVIVHGGPLAILDVCISKECGKHHPKAKSVSSSGTKGASGVDQKAERKYQDVVWKHQSDERGWRQARHAAVGDEVMRVALDHVSPDAVGPTFGKLLLVGLSSNARVFEFPKQLAFPTDDNGDIDLPELEYTQVVEALVMYLANQAIGWYDSYSSDDENYADSVALLTGLGATDPKSVIADAMKAYADANPKPKKPRKPRTKKAVKKTAKKGAK